MAFVNNTILINLTRFVDNGPFPWVNLNFDSGFVGVVATNISDINGVATDVFLEKTVATSTGFVGTGVVTNLTGYPDTVISRGWRGASPWQMKLGGLTPNETYSIKMFSSIPSWMNASDVIITVNGVSETHTAEGNNSEIHDITFVADALGEATIDIANVTYLTSDESSVCLIELYHSGNIDTVPSFTTQPQDLSVTEGDLATFTVVVDAEPAATVDWERFVSGSWVNVGEGLSYSFTAALSDDGAIFRAVATNSEGTTESNQVDLTVDKMPEPLTIMTQPVPFLVLEDGEALNLSVVATGYPAPLYQWEVDAGAGWQNIPGATNDWYSKTVVFSDSGNMYRVKIYNDVETIYSNTTELTVTSAVEPPVITVQPQDVTITEGLNATFTVTATSSEPLTYVWKSYNTLGHQTILPSTSDTAIVLATLAKDQYKYEVAVTNSAGTALSTQAILTVIPELGVNDSDFDIEFDQTGTPKFTVTTKDNLGNPTGLDHWFEVLYPSGKLVQYGSEEQPIIFATGVDFATFNGISTTAGRFLQGDYEFTLYSKGTDIIYSTTKVCTFSVDLNPLSMEGSFNTFQPDLSIEDTSSYVYSGYSVIVARTFTAVLENIGEITSPQAVFDLQKDGGYYDTVYDVTLTSNLTLTDTAEDWVTVKTKQTLTERFDILVPYQPDEIIDKLTAFKEYIDTQTFEGFEYERLVGDYKSVISIFHHAIERIRENKLEGLDKYFEQIAYLLHYRNNIENDHTYLHIVPFDYSIIGSVIIEWEQILNKPEFGFHWFEAEW